VHGARRDRDVEALSRLRERLTRGCRPVGDLSRGLAGGELDCRGVRGRRAEPQLRDEHHHEPRFDDTADEPRSQPYEEEPACAVASGCQRRCARVVEGARATQRVGEARFAGEIGPGHRHRRDARDERRRQVGRLRCDRRRPALPVLGHDRLADPPLVRRTLRSGHLLHPRGGREAGRGQPSRRVVRELVVRGPRPGDADHEPPQAVGERRALLDASPDLRGRDLGAVLGFAPGVPLAKQAGTEEPCDGYRENQRDRCDLARRHAPTFLAHRDNCAPSPSLGEVFVERGLRARYRQVIARSRGRR
jgi:hypothetical protein